MPLWDTLIAGAAKYGPSLVKAMGQATSGGSPMYPGGPSMGFAAPAGKSYALGGPRKKHRRGLSGADIRGAQKVARLVQHFGYKPKIKAHRRRR
jgi:hypothetical protein